jgi:hypothetical protein
MACGAGDWLLIREQKITLNGDGAVVPVQKAYLNPPSGNLGIWS